MNLAEYYLWLKKQFEEAAEESMSPTYPSDEYRLGVAEGFIRALQMLDKVVDENKIILIAERPGEDILRTYIAEGHWRNSESKTWVAEIKEVPDELFNDADSKWYRDHLREFPRDYWKRLMLGDFQIGSDE